MDIGQGELRELPADLVMGGVSNDPLAAMGIFPHML